MNWPWRKKVSVPRYIDAPELLEWLHRILADDDLHPSQKDAYRHVQHQVGRMEWRR